jgi:SAM-dependent methyltransferase
MARTRSEMTRLKGVAIEWLTHRREPRPRCQRLVRRLVAGRSGLEIGGPTRLFSGEIPVYSKIARLDNVNFSRSTTWEGEIVEGNTFVFHPRRPAGRQYLLEATDLSPIRDGSYDVVVSSHTLEHSANPLQALAEWRRVLREGGTLLVVIPHKERTFDHRRPVTAFEHLVDDFERGTTEDDLTHFDEIMRLHDVDLDPGIDDVDAFTARSKENATNRCFHQHVFDTELALRTVDHAELEVLVVEPMLPCHIILVARRMDAPDNSYLMRPDAPWRATSPFALDRSAPNISRRSEPGTPGDAHFRKST